MLSVYSMFHMYLSDSFPTGLSCHLVIMVFSIIPLLRNENKYSGKLPDWVTGGWF